MSKSVESALELQQEVLKAVAEGQPLNLTGGNSKAFYGRSATGTTLAVNRHCGVINYEPKELLLTARTGTPLSEIETLLAEQRQMLAFEPPHFGNHATLGGTISCGLSGPRRPYAGAARDFVLGVRIINGRGEILRFGGEVMKNVAGYDVSRLICGSLGTLGILLDVSLKVLPLPESEITLVQERSAAEAIRMVNIWAGLPLPISATCYDGLLHIRLSGVPEAVAAGKEMIGGSEAAIDHHFWADIREQRHPFFHTERPLWRLSLPPQSAPLPLPGKELIDWGGAQRWLLSDASPKRIRSAAEALGGYATLFRHAGDNEEVFHPLSAPIKSLHQRLKHAFDPHAIFNPGRLYPDL